MGQELLARIEFDVLMKQLDILQEAKTCMESVK